MKIRLIAGILFLCIFTLVGCGPRLVPATTILPFSPTNSPIPAGLTQEQFATLSSLQKVDEYPLYTMTYAGAYHPQAAILPIESTAKVTKSSPS